MSAQREKSEHKVFAILYLKEMGVNSLVSEKCRNQQFSQIYESRTHRRGYNPIKYSFVK